MKKLFIVFCLLPTLIFGQELQIFREVELDVFPFEYNTSRNEFGCKLIGDTLYFAGMREAKPGGKSARLQSLYDYFQVHRVVLDRKGNAKRKPGYDFRLSSEFHDGPLCYNHVTGQYFITRSGYKDARIENKVFRRRIIELKIDMFDPISKKTESFPYNSESYSVAHPSLTVTGDTLYFSSDMPGGFGGKDIYRSVYRRGRWSEPVNLGKTVNSEYDELYPSIHKSGAFFFTSDRPEGYGGLDIYACKIHSNGHFSYPFLLEDSINSAYDDFGLTVADHARFGFFSSNRKGNGDDDIYQVMFYKLTRIINGIVLDSLNHNYLSNVNVDLKNEKGEHIDSYLTDNRGRFTTKVSVGQHYKVVATKEHYKKVEVPLNYHVDSLQLQMQGIHRLQLTALDAETHKPLENFVVRGAQVGEFLWDGHNGKCMIQLLPGAINKFRVESEGYLIQSVKANTNNLPYGVIMDTVLLYPYETDKIFELENIFYDYNKWNLKGISKRELDKLVSIMKENPDVTVHFYSHTDSRGSDEYNMHLSQKRSLSCEQYLVECGIERQRIVPRGFGERKLLNNCSDGVECPEELHQRNRRTEIKFE